MASNMNRNPKDLRDLIEKCKYPEAGLEEKKGKEFVSINDADKNNSGPTENIFLLRDRIEEQSRLIMILKQRADDFIHKNIALEELNKKLNEKCQLIETEVDTANRNAATITKRFSDLSENHVELIKIKDEYKQKNVILVSENQRLMNELNGKTAPQIANLKIENENFRLKIGSLESSLTKYEENVEELTQKIQTLTKEKESELTRLKTEKEAEKNFFDQKLKEYSQAIDELKAKKQEKEHQLKELNENFEKTETKLKTVQKENEDLVNRLTKLVEEKHNLMTNVNDLSKANETLIEKLRHEKHTKNENAGGKHAESKLAEAAKRYRELEMEYAAYKKHANELIQQEKEINAKLKFLIG